jgi:TusA-related sulfurtransferase
MQEPKLERKSEGEYTLDVRGQTCPFPQILSQLALEKLREGSILEVITDNPPSARDVPIALRKKGYEVEVKKSNGQWHIVVKK